MIHFENVYLAFATGTVFENFSFSIAPGQHACISGPSGSGKSSVLKIIQGYLVPAKGSVTVGGLPLNKNEVKEIRRKIAYVPQNVNLPVASGRELARFIGITDGFGAIENHLIQLGLQKEMFSRPFDQMSGGQKQRIIIAVCLSLGREILLLDEPSSSLDDESVNSLIRVVKNLKNVTIVSASHNPKWINAMDQVVRLNGLS